MLELIDKDTISILTAEVVFENMFCTGKEASEIIRKKKLSRTSNAHEIRGMVKQVMTNNSEAVSDYSSGKHQALTSATGRIMGATRGRVNPGIVAEIII